MLLLISLLLSFFILPTPTLAVPNYFAGKDKAFPKEVPLSDHRLHRVKAVDGPQIVHSISYIKRGLRLSSKEKIPKHYFAVVHTNTGNMGDVALGNLVDKMVVQMKGLKANVALYKDVAGFYFTTSKWKQAFIVVEHLKKEKIRVQRYRLWHDTFYVANL